MFIEIEHELDPQTYIYAELVETDESFSDLDNHYPRTGHELRDIKIVTYLEGTEEINITKAVMANQPKYFESLKEMLISKYAQEMREAI